MKQGVLFVLSMMLSDGYAGTLQDLKNSDIVHSEIRHSIKSGFRTPANRTSIQNMDRKNSPLDKAKLDCIFRDIESNQSWITGRPYREEFRREQFQKIQECVISHDCFLAVYYAGYATVPRDHGKRYYNKYLFYFLDEAGNQTATLKFELDSDPETKASRPDCSHI